MRFKEISEDVASDLRRNEMARSVCLALYNYLYHRRNDDPDFEMRMAVFHDGTEHPMIKATWVEGIPQFFRRLFFVFEKSMYGRGGSHIESSAEFISGANHMIRLQLWDDSVTGIMQYLRTDQGQEVMIHELQHYIDALRQKTKRTDRQKDRAEAQAGGEDQPKKASTTNAPKDDSEEEQTRYYNDDFERNAYFHNFAEPLMSVLTYIKKEGIEVLELYDKDAIPLDFNKFMAERLKRASPVVRRSVEHQLPDTRRRFIARLYQLHQEYVRAWKEFYGKSETPSA